MSARTMTDVLTRVSFRFDELGRHAACLAGDADGNLHVETWVFDDVKARRAILTTEGSETLRTQPIPTGDGRVVVLRNGSPLHELALIETTDLGAQEHQLARLAHPVARLLPSADPETLALLVTLDSGRCTTIWRITTTGQLEAMLDHPGPIGGGLWLDDIGRRLAVTHVVHNRAEVAVADLHQGSMTSLPTTMTGSPMLFGHRSGLALVAREFGDGPRLGVTSLDSSQPPRFPLALNEIAGSVAPLAVSPDGFRFALRVERGARSHIAVYDADSDQVTESALPPGVIRGLGSWTSSGLRFPFSTPNHPTTVAHLDSAGSCRLPARRPHDRSWAPAHLETLEGPAGPIEAVVYGGPAWRDSPHLVLALHGGPASAWQFGFSPLFQRLIAWGVAVVAPNQRGSTGYGRDHHHALHGAWGVPDLADIRHLAEALADHRSRIGVERTSLYGNSYGAFLALLAAGHAPELWSRCAVVAPFLSGPQLYRDASASVRAMVDRLGGLAEPDGHQDALSHLDQFPGPLLVLHGTEDDIVPVSHARALRQHLLAAGRNEDKDFHYLEVPGGGHGLLDDVGGTEIAEVLARFFGRQ